MLNLIIQPTVGSATANSAAFSPIESNVNHVLLVIKLVKINNFVFLIVLHQKIWMLVNVVPNKLIIMEYAVRVLSIIVNSVK